MRINEYLVEARLWVRSVTAGPVPLLPFPVGVEEEPVKESVVAVHVSFAPAEVENQGVGGSDPLLSELGGEGGERSGRVDMKEEGVPKGVTARGGEVNVVAVGFAIGDSVPFSPVPPHCPVYNLTEREEGCVDSLKGRLARVQNREFGGEGGRVGFRDARRYEVGRPPVPDRFFVVRVCVNRRPSPYARYKGRKRLGTGALVL